MINCLVIFVLVLRSANLFFFLLFPSPIENFYYIELSILKRVTNPYSSLSLQWYKFRKRLYIYKKSKYIGISRVLINLPLRNRDTVLCRLAFESYFNFLVTFPVLFGISHIPYALTNGETILSS